ncbi:hypothetical protein, partial [Pseudomonas aeruginosa]|uniref:hypothetical protein n=1 Tax=Pseudomonas aeruginosa TaxID=287 RepID=UPI00215647F4
SRGLGDVYKRQRRDALLAIRSRSFGALPDEVRQRLRCRPPVGQYQLCQGVAPPG